MIHQSRALTALALSLVLSGCVTMQSHDKKTSNIESASRTGGLPAAIAQLESTATTEEEKTALLYNCLLYTSDAADE